MPANFPEVWLDRVIQNITESDVATFLEGIPELDAEVTELGEGTLTESNIIHVATTDFEVDILVNNNSYPIPFQVYEDGSVQIKLDKLQTKVVTVTDDQIMGASYDKIDVVTKTMTSGINERKYARALHSIAPQSNTVKTPVLKATGLRAGETEPLVDPVTGRLRLVYDDIVRFKGECEKAGFKKAGKRLVCCNEHWNDLLLDRKNFGDKLVNYVEGTPAPVIAGFKLYQYDISPRYTAAGVKKAFDSIDEETDQVASVAFMPNAIGKKTGLTKQYFAAAKDSPSRQTNDLAYRHYFVATPFRNQLIGAIL